MAIEDDSLTNPRSAINDVVGHPIVQMCWVVDDIETAVSAWAMSVGAGPFHLAAHIEFGELTYWGVPATLDQSSALGQWGPVQLELLQQHCDSPSGVREMRDDGHLGLHHVTWFADDIEAEGDRLRALGFDEVMTATLPVMGGMRIAWYDTRPLLGCMAEIYEESQLMRRFYQRIADAAVGWDGSEPLRPL
jgi:Glyoxalase/Bleomycin resistance protein/Dioxygenase superfamily